MLAEYDAKRYTYNGKVMTEYEATQEQRYTERQIRRWKREKAALKAIDGDTAESAAKIKEWRKREKDFIQQTGLKIQVSRSQIGGYSGNVDRR